MMVRLLILISSCFSAASRGASIPFLISDLRIKSLVIKDHEGTIITSHEIKKFNLSSELASNYENSGKILYFYLLKSEMYLKENCFFEFLGYSNEVVLSLKVMPNLNNDIIKNVQFEIGELYRSNFPIQRLLSCDYDKYIMVICAKDKQKTWLRRKIQFLQYICLCKNLEKEVNDLIGEYYESDKEEGTCSSEDLKDKEAMVSSIACQLTFYLCAVFEGNFSFGMIELLMCPDSKECSKKEIDIIQKTIQNAFDEVLKGAELVLNSVLEYKSFKSVIKYNIKNTLLYSKITKFKDLLTKSITGESSHTVEESHSISSDYLIKAFNKLDLGDVNNFLSKPAKALYLKIKQDLIEKKIEKTNFCSYFINQNSAMIKKTKQDIFTYTIFSWFIKYPSRKGLELIIGDTKKRKNTPEMVRNKLNEIGKICKENLSNTVEFPEEIKDEVKETFREMLKLLIKYENWYNSANIIKK